MASAYRKRDSWCLSFRHIGQRGSDRTHKVCPWPVVTKTEADRIARRVDDACRAVEESRDVASLNYLVSGGFLSRREAEKYGDLAPEVAAEVKEPREAAPDTREVTIRQAHESHPSFTRENHRKGRKRRESLYHAAAVERYVAWSGSPLLRDVTVPMVAKYIAHLEHEGYAYDTRRHFLVPLRRASMMAPHFGLPEMLRGFALDRRPSSAPEVDIAPAEEFRELLCSLETDLARYCPVALMGVMGLRPSEVIRLRVSDFKGDVLSVAARERKTGTSRRNLPIPSIVSRQLARWIEARQKAPEDPLVTGPLGSAPLDEYNFRRLMKPVGICPKNFRKVFATASIRDLDISPAVVEDYLGHTRAGVLAVTARHYLGSVRTTALKVVSDAWDRFLSAPTVHPGILQNTKNADAA